MSQEKGSCHGCQHGPSPSSVTQSLTELDFERGLWGAAIEDDLGRVQHLLQRGTPASIRDSSGSCSCFSAKSLGDFSRHFDHRYCSLLRSLWFWLWSQFYKNKTCRDNSLNAYDRWFSQGLGFSITVTDVFTIDTYVTCFHDGELYGLAWGPYGLAWGPSLIFLTRWLNTN